MICEHIFRFTVKWLNSSIWALDMTLSDATIPGQSKPRINGNERITRIPQSSRIIVPLPSDCLMSYSGQSSYSTAEMQ